ncbi:hypothetical protein AB6834_02640 [Carnobacterium divergens]|uniref:hypothetical protein n=1 Tax=Carnobacterium divergens TaxID=2748 RepID=UPI0039BEAB61
MELKKVEYKIEAGVTPKIMIDGENVEVVSLSYQWVTLTGDQTVQELLIVSGILTKTQIMIDVSVNSCTGEVFYQEYPLG